MIVDMFDACINFRKQEMRRLERLVKDLNTELYNPVGLNILWPRKVAFLFVSGNSWHSFSFHANLLTLD